MPILLALTAWGDRWTPPPGGPPVQVHHDTCGRTATPVVACSACGDPLTADEVTVRPGPGGRIARGTALVAHRLLAADG